MSRRARFVGRLVLVALPVGAFAAAAERTVVGPNVLVSRDGDVPHVETMIAANPRNPKNLVGASIAFVKGDGGGRNKVYASSDGGSTWTASEFPEESGTGFGGDPQVAFGATGTAYFVGLFVGGGNDRNSMNVYRSEDAGVTWQKPVRLKFADHEQLVVDHTTGAYAGRVYLTGEESVKGSKEIEDLQMHRRVVLYRSSDDGRSFVGPIEVGRGGTGGLGAVNMVVFSDGMLWIPTLAYPNYAVDKKADTWKVLASTSTDGGVTLSPSSHSLDIRFGGSDELHKSRSEPRTDQMALPSFAVDASGGKFRDRLYAVWTEAGGGRFRLMLASSGDRGKTWTKPKPVDASEAADASQFQPMVAVNPDGVVGVFWYDTAGFPKHDRYETWFSASVDGGASFLPKARVSTGVSRPMGAGNMRPAPLASQDRGMEVVDFLSGFSRYPNGGDYIGMTADSNGAFHPFWSDARSGTFQLYSAAIRVAGGEKSPAEAGKTERVHVSLSGKVALEFDPTRYDAEASEVTVSVRIRNTSQETLHPPFRIEIRETAHPYTVKAGFDRADKPVFVNASNGKPLEGAVFESGTETGAPLEPGAITDPIVWRLKVRNPSSTDFHVGSEVSGYVVKKESPGSAGVTKEERK